MTVGGSGSGRVHHGCTVLYCTVLYCTVLYCTVLLCLVLLQAASSAWYLRLIGLIGSRRDKVSHIGGAGRTPLALVHVAVESTDGL